MGSPGSFFFYKIGHMGANAYKSITKASLGLTMNIMYLFVPIGPALYNERFPGEPIHG